MNLGFVVVGQYTPTDATPDEVAEWRAYGFTTRSSADSFLSDNDPWFPLGARVLEVEQPFLAPTIR